MCLSSKGGMRNEYSEEKNIYGFDGDRRYHFGDRFRHLCPSEDFHP
jgi:hypothetical protein